MADSEDIGDIDNIDDIVDSSNTNSKSRPDSFFSIIGDLTSKLNWKIILFIFLLYIFLNTDMFIDKGLSRIKNAVDFKHPTTKGTLIQALLMVIGYAIIKLLVDSSII